MAVRKIILASSNHGKCREIQRAFSDAAMPVEMVIQSQLGIEDVEETEDSFAGNALLKARHASRQSGLPALADDSGLAVDALGGAPGIYSARYAGPDSTSDEKMDKLLSALDELPNSPRTARFCCALAYVQSGDDPNPVIIEATWEGEILHEKRGNQGFGYDPIFYDPKQACSAAELDPDIKNRISHRGQALRIFLEAL